MEFIAAEVLKQGFVEFPIEMSDRAYLYEYIAQVDVSAILLISINDFRYISSCYGYEFGDYLLKHVSSKLFMGVSDCGKVFRLVGNEFVVVIDKCTVSEIKKKARLLMKNIDEKVFSFGEFELLLSICIGAYVPEKRNEPAEEIIRKAEVALFKAKSGEKGRLVFYDKTMDGEIKRKLLLTAEMKRGMKENEFYILYQPIFDIGKGKITEAEALLRWGNSRLGSISPAEFIPVAEENGLIYELSYFVMENVFKQVRQWEDKGIRVKIAINISPVQLLNKNFISKLIRKFDIDYKKIKFEITETQILKNEKRVVRFLGRILNVGMDVSLDDFGVGFSSIRNMVLFPVSEVKIDKCFVDKLLRDKKAEVIIESIIHAAKKVNYKVIAEGVETRKQFEKLKDMGCDKIQGYYIGKPIPPEDITNFIGSFQI